MLVIIVCDAANAVTVVCTHICWVCDEQFNVMLGTVVPVINRNGT